MEGCHLYLYWTLLCSTGLLHSYAQVQTEEYKTKHLPYLKTAEDGNKKQLVSYALFFIVCIVSFSFTLKRFQRIL